MSSIRDGRMGSMGGEMYPFGDGYRLPRPDLTAGLLLTLTDEQRGGAAQARNRFTEDRDPRQHGHDPYAGQLGVFDQRGSGADQREDQVRRQRPVSLGQKTLGIVSGADSPPVAVMPFLRFCQKLNN